MAVGKNTGLNKGGKKGLKKKVVDPFTRKNWYHVKVPSMFTTQVVGKTLVNRGEGVIKETDFLKHRVFEISLGDLQNDNDSERSFSKFKFITENVQGRNVYTNFHGMELSSDKLRSIVKKWQTLIEAWVDAKTIDGYLLRVFSIGFTNKDETSRKKTCYAQRTQVRNIRKIMIRIITELVSNINLITFVKMLLPNAFGKEIEVKSRKIFQLHDVYVKKVKVLRRPCFDLSRQKEIYQETSDVNIIIGEKINRPVSHELPEQESIKV